MSKPAAIFSYTPVKNVRSSPASNKTNSAKQTKSQQASSTVTEASPRKCKIQTEVQTIPRGTNINIKNRVQITQMSPRSNQELRTPRASPRKDQAVNENRKDVKKQTSASKSCPAPVMNKTSSLRIMVIRQKLQATRTYQRSFNRSQYSCLLGENSTSAKRGLFEADSTSEDVIVPSNINVKSIRSCFERRENRIPSKPPPSPSPSRHRSRLPETQPVTPKNSNVNLKGILRSKCDNSPAFRVPSSSNTPTPRVNRLRRSVSTGTINRAVESPKHGNLSRSSSQTITPKHRVKFQDEVTPECFSPVLLESKADHSSGDSMVGEVTNLTVAVRVRPPFPGERSVVSVEGKTVKVKAPGSEHTFSYDYCFDSSGDEAASQQDVFHTMVEPLVTASFQGYNVCLFAYGQTGSGKSYSMMGEEITSSSTIPEKAGIIPRFSQQLFKIIQNSAEYSQTRVEISYFEIYNEKIHDLLGPFQNGRGTPLRVREHPEFGPYVVDLTVHQVHSFDALQDWLRLGNSHKAMAATEMNVNSSRSHTIFSITLSQSQVNDRPSVCSKISLVDLAGSERVAHTCATGDRLKEGVSINRSLLTLGKVISSLAENKKRGFIPYRESVLTWLLRESLGGNSHTAMLATINPSCQFVEETLSTLRYACQARNIINTVRINESPHEKKIRELMEEIQRLKDGIYIKDHSECEEKIQSLKEKLDKTKLELAEANLVCAKSEEEIEKLEREWTKTQELNFHKNCDKKLQELQSCLSTVERQKCNLEEELKDLRKIHNELKDKNSEHEIEIRNLKLSLDDVNMNSKYDNEEIYRLENEIEKYKDMNKNLKLQVSELEKELEECRDKNSNYEKDISEMKNSMIEIKKNISHDHCESQILMLQTALDEAERFSRQFKEKIVSLEKKCNENTVTSNHEGCEKEISYLKETINELKLSNDHSKCDQVIEKLKTSLSGAEKLVFDLENEISQMKEERDFLKGNEEQSCKEIFSLKNKVAELEKTNHSECEERLNTLKKALAVAKSMNAHTHCENRISELEIEIQNLQSVTAEHSKCEEKINNLFFAVEKYADENNKLIEQQNKEVEKYIEKIKSLGDEISDLTSVQNENKISQRNNSQDLMHLENQIKTLKEENSKIKKKKVEDEKKITSLEQQVISLTKELLDVKNQLRSAIREKESNASLCAQLQEQLAQQDRKLASAQSTRPVSDDNKENWETPSKVIRRSIAQYSKSKKNSRRSLVMKLDEINQAVKDAQDICTRLKIPWVFQLEPEVSTHSWFDVNVRVWDQRTMSSVRWPQDVFMGWLREMKEEIMSKSRGQKLFHSATWLQDTKDPEPLSQDSSSEDSEKMKTLQEEIEILQRKIVSLEKLCNPQDKMEVLTAVSTLGKAVTQLSSKLGLSSPLKPSNTKT